MDRPSVTKPRSPLTDPRSLVSSVSVHLLVLAVIGGLLAVTVADRGQARSRPAPLKAEIEPVDNRAPQPEPGGSSGGDLDRPTVSLSAEAAQSKTSAEQAVADALLDEVAPIEPGPVPPRAEPGEHTSGLGLMLGPSGLGLGGSGGGSGTGQGTGSGPSTAFFGATEHAESFAYVIDCSGSMATHDAIGLAKRELLSSLAQLPPDARFGIVFYTTRFSVFPDASGRKALMPATSENKSRVRLRLAQIRPDGGTDPRPAVDAALTLKPEVVFLLTDGQELSYEDVQFLEAHRGPTRIHTIDFSGPSPAPETSPLRRLAAETGGTYRHVNTATFPRR